MRKLYGCQTTTTTVNFKSTRLSLLLLKKKPIHWVLILLRCCVIIPSFLAGQSAKSPEALVNLLPLISRDSLFLSSCRLLFFSSSLLSTHSRFLISASIPILLSRILPLQFFISSFISRPYLICRSSHTCCIPSTVTLFLGAFRIASSVYLALYSLSRILHSSPAPI